MRKSLLITLFCSLLVVGCSPSPTSALPPVMPDQMPTDFAFSLLYGVNSIHAVDTFNGVVIKDLVQAGTAEAKLTLSTEEMRTIYQKMHDINILKEFQFNDGDGCKQMPYSTDLWQIRINGESTTFQWSEENCVITEDERQLADLRFQVIRLIQAHPGYQGLPDAVGGYD